MAKSWEEIKREREEKVRSFSNPVQNNANKMINQGFLVADPKPQQRKWEDIRKERGYIEPEPAPTDYWKDQTAKTAWKNVNAGINMIPRGMVGVADATIGGLGIEPVNKFLDSYKDYYKKADEELAMLNKGHEFAGGVAQGIGQGIPTIALALMNPAAAAGSLVPTTAKGTQLVANAASLANPTTLNAARTVAMSLKSNPALYSSMVTSVGNQYLQGVNEGASREQALKSAIIGGVPSALIEVSGGIENITNILANKTKGVAGAMLQSALEEGFEEIVQYPIENIGQKVAYDKDMPLFSMQEQAIINPKEMAFSGAVGATVGGLMGGGAAGVNTALNKGYSKIIDKEYKNTVNSLPEDSPILERVKQMQNDNVNIDDNTKIWVINSARQQQGTFESETDKLLQNDRQKETFFQNENNVLEQTVERGRNIVKTQNNASQAVDPILSAFNIQNINNAREVKQNVYEFYKNTIISDSNTSKPILNKSSGMNIEVSRATINQTFQADDKYIKNQDNEIKVAAMANMVDLVQNGEFTVIDNSDTPSSKKTYANITGTVNINGVPYEITMDIRRTDNGRKLFVHSLSTNYQQVVSKKSGVVYNGVDNRVRQQYPKVYDILDRIGKATNTKFKFVETIYDPSGQEAGFANGQYDPTTDSIEIALDTFNPFMVVAKHELTHVLEKESPKLYKEYKDYVLQAMKENGTYQAKYDDMVKLYENAGQSIDKNGIEDELVADATELFLTDEKAINELVAENKTLGQKILDVLRKLIDKIEDALKVSGFTEGWLNTEQLREAERLWVNALNSVSETEKKSNSKTDKKQSLKDNPFNEKSYHPFKETDKWEEQSNRRINWLTEKVEKNPTIKLSNKSGSQYALVTPSIKGSEYQVTVFDKDDTPIMDLQRDTLKDVVNELDDLGFTYPEKAIVLDGNSIKSVLLEKHSEYKTNKEALNLATEAIKDLQKVKFSIPSTGREVDRNRSGIRTIADGISREFINKGYVELKGRKIKSLEDLAVISQVFRDPRFETFRIFYTKNNKIVAHEAISSRIPGMSSAFLNIPKRKDFSNDFDFQMARGNWRNTKFDDMKGRMKRLKADGYYLLHNHPSGNPDASKADVSLTKDFMDNVEGFKGHVIINSNKYGWLEMGEYSYSIHVEDMAQQQIELFLKPTIDHPLLSESINGTDKAASIAKSLQLSEDKTAIVYTDVKGAIRGIEEIPNGMFNDRISIRGFLRNRGRHFGSGWAFLSTTSQDIFAKSTNLVKEKYLTDSILLIGEDSYGHRADMGTRQDDAYGWAGIENDNFTSERVNESGKKFSMKDLVFDDEIAGYTKERIDTIFDKYGAKSTPKYSKAYIAYMSPDEFLSLSTTNIERIESQSRKLDIEQLRDEYQDIFLQFDQDTNEITGHEGRHRMVALRNEGIKQVPVVFIPDGEKGRYNRSKIDNIRFEGQEFRNGRAPGIAEVKNMIPVSAEYKNELDSTFVRDRGIQFSLKDNQGRELTKEQQNYFKDSKVKDSKGNLLTMYHGTPRGGITQFNSGTYFTENKEYADVYQSPNASSISVKQGEITPKTYEVYLNIKKPFDTRNKKERDIFNKEYYRKYGTGTPLMESGLPDWVDGMDLQEFIEEQGYDYDGLILDEGATGGYGEEVKSRGISYVVFDSNQVKNIDNKNPTSNLDIRYQLRDNKSANDVEKLQNTVTRLKEQFKLTKGIKLDEKAVRRLSKTILKEYSSKYSSTELETKLYNVYMGMVNSDMEYDEAQTIITEVARDIIENASALNDAMYKQYSDLRNTMRNTAIAIDDKYKGDFDAVGGWNDFRKKNFGRMNITNDGMSIDSLYQELSDLYPELFMKDIANPADQLLLISDVLDNLVPIYENPYNRDLNQAVEYLAFEIFDGMTSVQEAKPTFADRKKVEKQKAVESERQKSKERIKALRNKNADDVAWLKYQNKEKLTEVLNKEKAKRDEAVAKVRKQYQDSAYKTWWRNKINENDIKSHYQEMIKELRANRDEKLEQQKAKYKERVSGIYEDRKIRQAKDRIRNMTKKLSKMLRNPTQKQHIPKALDKTTAELLAMLDFTTDKQNENTQLKLRDLRAEFEKIAKVSDEDGLSAAADPYIVEALETLHGKRIADMNLQEIEVLRDIVGYFENMVRTYNKAFRNGKWVEISTLSENILNDLKTNAPINDSAYGGILYFKDMMNWGMLTPQMYFERMGNTFNSLYDDFRVALDVKINNTKIAQDYMKNLLKNVGQKELQSWSDYFWQVVDKSKNSQISEWTGRRAEIKSIKLDSGATIELTQSQLMSFYLLMKREQARGHIFGLGVKAAPIVAVNDKGIKYVKKQFEPVKITLDDATKMIAMLTKEQRRIADGIGKFMNTYSKQWVNEATLQNYGYELAKEENYFPIKSDKDFLKSDFDNTNLDPTFTSMGFLKATVKGAGNAIILEDVFDVFTEHADKAATYNAFVGITESTKKIINFKTEDNSIKQAMNKKFGIQAFNYLKKFMVDLQGGLRTEGGAPLVNALIRINKRTVLGLNIRTVVQQPTAIIRAAALIEPKYLTKGVAMKGNMDEMLKYSPIALWKSWGYFNLDTGRTMKDIILDTTPVLDKQYFAIQKADDITWTKIWNAVKLEVADAEPKLKEGSKEFYDAVNYRFSEIIDRTQVVDTVMHRSDAMRQKDSSWKMLTAFMSEPTKSYNLLLNAVEKYNADKNAENKKALNRTFSAWTATMLVNTLIVSLVDMWRRKEDDDETFKEKWFDNIINDVTGYVPIVRDIYSLFEGYSVKRMEYNGIERIVRAINRSKKYIEEMAEDKKHSYPLRLITKDWIESVAYVFGIGAINVSKDLQALLKNYTKWINDEGVVNDIYEFMFKK